MTLSLFSRLLLAVSFQYVGSTSSFGQAAFDQPDQASKQPGLLKSEFLFETAPFRFSHSSTITETKGGLLAAWAAGSRERALDVGIWTSRQDGGRWSEPEEVANGVWQSEQRRYPCWNPVLFQPRRGPLLLFYKIGPSPESWWGMLMTSTDNGKTWSKPDRLPRGIVGPVRNKPIQLADGTLLCGASTEDAGWLVHMERKRGENIPWGHTRTLNNPMEFGAIQPTILLHRTGDLQILCRSKQGKVVESWSKDGGDNWSRMKPTALPNPNSAVDAVMLIEGMALLVYNHSATNRGVLNVAVSQDGTDWQAALTLENQTGEEYSYPAVIQTSDGLVHVTYSWNRKRIKHVVIDPWQLKLRDMPGGQWP